MNVLLDSNVLSAAIRRSSPDPTLGTHVLPLLRTKTAFLIGAIRQEVLSGLSTPEHYAQVHARLAAVPVIPTNPSDHDLAAQYYNRCRRAGIQGHHHDFLLCAVSTRLNLPIWTTDQDFLHFSPHIPVNLYQLPRP